MQQSESKFTASAHTNILYLSLKIAVLKLIPNLANKLE